MGPNVGVAASFRDPDGNHLSVFGMVPSSPRSSVVAVPGIISRAVQPGVVAMVRRMS